MVVMAAKWRGKCRLCGCVIVEGSQIEWTKETGARHLTAKECEAAALLAPPVNFELRGSQGRSPSASLARWATFLVETREAPEGKTLLKLAVRRPMGPATKSSNC